VTGTPEPSVEAGVLGGGVENRLDRLIASVEREMAGEERALARLERPVDEGLVPLLIAVDVVAANLLLWLVLPGYPLHWITASFFLYVVYPFLLLLPSRGTGDGREGGFSFGRFAGGAGWQDLAGHRWTIAGVFWNAFFVNSQPLAPAFFAVFGLDIVFALVSGSGPLRWLVVFQSAAIMVYYLAIVVFRPHSGRFLDSLVGIQDDVTRRLRFRVEPVWKVILPIGVVAGVVAVVLVVAMVMPGFTLGVIWRSEPNVAGAGLVAVLFVLAGQVILVRYAQGTASRRLARKMGRRRCEVLARHVLGPLRACRDGLEDDRAGSIDRFTNDFARLRAVFVHSRVYRTQRQEIGGLLPVYVVVPDLDLVLNPETLRILGEREEGRQFL